MWIKKISERFRRLIFKPLTKIIITLYFTRIVKFVVAYVLSSIVPKNINQALL